VIHHGISFGGCVNDGRKLSQQTTTKMAHAPTLAGSGWHEIDPTYLVIRLLDKLHVIRLAEQRQIKMERVKKAA